MEDNGSLWTEGKSTRPFILNVILAMVLVLRCATERESINWETIGVKYHRLSISRLLYLADNINLDGFGRKLFLGTSVTP
jgi:hypothetical protein